MPEPAVAEAVSWTLRRSRKARRLRIVVRGGRVEVVAPGRMLRATIDAFVATKQQWIRAKVDAWRAREVEALPERFESGSRLLYRGSHLELVVEPAAVRRAAVSVGGRVRVRVPKELDGDERETVARQAVVRWMRERVRTDAARLIDRWAPAVGSRPSGLRIGSQKTLWGSCSPRGVISLNWQLVTAPERILEYVVVHELCHLIEAHHGPSFWAMVGRLLPDWRERRDWLRGYGLTLR